MSNSVRQQENDDKEYVLIFDGEPVENGVVYVGMTKALDGALEFVESESADPDYLEIVELGKHHKVKLIMTVED